MVLIIGLLPYPAVPDLTGYFPTSIYLYMDHQNLPNYHTAWKTGILHP